MKWRTVSSVLISTCVGISWAFSVHDDLFAFPQYEVVFLEEYISGEETSLKLDLAASGLDGGKGTHPESSIVPEPTDVSLQPSTDQPNAYEPGGGSQTTQVYERMILDNHEYLCSIPRPQSNANETRTEISREEEEKEVARATDRGWELLNGMKGNCMYYQSGWWSYSFCYQTEVKQFHPLPPQRGGQPTYPPVEDTRVPAFILGEFKDSQAVAKRSTEKPKGDSASDTSALAIRKKGDSRYMVQQLTGGSTCDLTGKPRKIEVQFHCHPQSTDRIGWIKETATCSYLMVIYTPRLCNDVAFLPPKDHKAAPIECREIITDEAQLATWNAKRASRMVEMFGKAAAAAAATSEAPSRPIVGGIEVGGMKLTGGDGQRISPPKAVEQIPNQGEVIARWNPDLFDGDIEVLGDEDLRQLGLDPDMIVQMREEIHREADGRPWKLEIVDIGGGERELVGIVEREDEVDTKKDGAKRNTRLKEVGKNDKKKTNGKSPKDEEESAKAKDERENEGSEETLKDEL